MATTNPRITITLTTRQHELLRAISANSGQSMSAFVQDILEQAQPVLERMAESFRRISVAHAEQKKRIAQELDLAQTAVEPFVDQVLGQFDLFMDRLEDAHGVSGGTARDEAPTGARQRTGEPSARRRPPPTNRGVTTPPLKTPKPAPAQRLKKVLTSPKVIQKKGAKNAI